MNTSSSRPVFETLQSLYAIVRESEREIALNLGLNLTDYRALSVLAQFGPMTAGKLAEDLGSTAATTTAITNRLELRGYVVRRRNTADRRQVLVSSTPASSQKILDLMCPLATAIDGHLQALPLDQRAAVASFLDVAQHLMRDHLQTFPQKEAR
ncbi:MarR family winged helix-turn-helix transcriptional regulator [Paeniglutamicibacter sp. NPDC091659]|uniref:MarR family winged helix-turn-helix transcriptional regulator n=1 Tax=Paeniglutamicibacter sp. NPDC091659 TaxID=3364389 RepID=UPI0037F555CC